MNNAAATSACLRARIYDAFPVEQPAFGRLLKLLDVEASRDVPTAAVTLGTSSRLRINPDFVARMCPTDHDLVMLVLHELHHVALGHTRLFSRVTRAQNWAFDCVINAQLCLLFPDAQWTALFRRCYRADAMPEALLRPPEGWRSDRETWLPGRAGEVHRALYSDRSVSYTDLFSLLETVLVQIGEGGLGELLGDHEARGEALPPDLLREVRDILAGWPMVDQRSGRDQGGARKSMVVARSATDRAAVLQLRRALLWVADTGRGAAAGSRRILQPAEGVLPYAPRPSRRDGVRRALGQEPLLLQAAIWQRRAESVERTRVYVDVSGSMDAHLPAVYAALAPLAGLLHPRVHLFSTEVVDISLAQLKRGVRTTTGGTDIAPVTRHMLEHKVRRALIVTDGWVGDVPEEHALRLRRSRARVSVAVSDGGDPGFTQRLSSRVWRLPATGETG